MATKPVFDDLDLRIMDALADCADTLDCPQGTACQDDGLFCTGVEVCGLGGDIRLDRLGEDRAGGARQHGGGQ